MRKHDWNKQAKELKAITGMTYNQCLNEIAKANGYKSYNSYVHKQKINTK